MPRPSLKRLLIFGFAFGLTAIVACLVGWWISAYVHSPVFIVQQRKEYPYRDGKFVLTYASDSDHLEILDPGSSILTWESEHAGPIILYKARRVPREAFPIARNVQISGDQITWTDGEIDYALTIRPKPPRAAKP
jgi:hypothetical protein